MNDAAKSCAGRPDFEIRDCRPEDVAAVVEIYNYWIRKGGSTMDTQEKSVESMAQWLAGSSPRETILLLLSEGIIQGWGIIKAYSDRPGYRVACETAVYLRPGRLRRGFGSAMKKALIERCREYGYHHLVAKIRAENTASIEYNRKLGYEVVGIQREIGHVAGQWRDVCIMQLILDDVPPFEPEGGYL